MVRKMLDGKKDKYIKVSNSIPKDNKFSIAVKVLNVQRTQQTLTYMSGEIIEADHHNEDHNCHCELGGNQV